MTTDAHQNIPESRVIDTVSDSVAAREVFGIEAVLHVRLVLYLLFNWQPQDSYSCAVSFWEAATFMILSSVWQGHVVLRLSKDSVHSPQLRVTRAIGWFCVQ